MSLLEELNDIVYEISQRKDELADERSGIRELELELEVARREAWQECGLDESGFRERLFFADTTEPVLKIKEHINEVKESCDRVQVVIDCLELKFTAFIEYVKAGGDLGHSEYYWSVN